MITDPPSEGTTQVITRLVSEIVIVGAEGTLGTVGSTAPALLYKE